MFQRPGEKPKENTIRDRFLVLANGCGDRKLIFFVEDSWMFFFLEKRDGHKFKEFTGDSSN